MPAILHDGVSIPALYLADSPNGVGNGNTGVTQFPHHHRSRRDMGCGLRKEPTGGAIGQEWAGKGGGGSIRLGPGMDMELGYFCDRSDSRLLGGPVPGSPDPPPAEIQGIQGQHVVGPAKHYVLNDQETHRDSVNVDGVGEGRAGDALPPFEASVKQGGAGAIMCSYNRTIAVLVARSVLPHDDSPERLGLAKDSS